MTTRKYSSRSQQTTLTASLSASATTASVVSGSALLGGITVSAGETFTIVIDPDTALEEIVDVTAVAGSTLTIVRGIDGSSGQEHSAGAVVRHMAIGRDYREANTHIEASTNVHGLAAGVAVVGDTTTQTLTNKTLTTPTIASFTNATHNHTNAAGGGTLTSAAVTDFTEAAQDAVAAALAAGTQSGITATYNDAANSISLNVNDPTITLSGDVTGSATMTDLGNVTITTTIPAGTIVDADVNSAAAIAKTKIAGTAITAADTGTVTSTMIADGTVVNADINSSAQIAYGKLNLTNSVVDADINASAAIAKTKISGTAITAADTGTVTSTMIADGTIVDADINASAAIAWTKIAPSATISATELGYLDGVTSAIQTQLDSKLGTSTAASTYAPLASPALTGTPTAPTAVAGTNTTQVATTAFVKTAVDNVVAAAPGALDTLNELASALGNDANFSTTVTNSLATKLPLAGGTMSGAIAMGSNKITGLGTPTVSGDAATKDYADTKLALSGGTMSGAIAMGTNKITGLGTPTASTDAATKGYIDTAVIAPANLTGPITSVGNATAIASQTGTGSTFVMNTSPTLVTPVLGVATATSINGTTIPTSKTLVATDSTAYVVPSQTGNSGKYLTTDGTTSSWGTVSSYSAPTLGSTSIASGSTVTNVNGLTINSTTIPTSKTLVDIDSSQTLTNKTINGSNNTITNISLTTGVTGILPVANGGTGITSLGTGVATALGTNVGSAGAFVTTSSTDTLTNKTLTAPVINLSINAQTTSYTLVLSDAGKLVEINNASANNLTVPLNSSVAYPVGTQINILQTGAGQTTVVATGGVTINGTPGLKLRAQWSGATLIKRATDTWVLVGDLSA